MKKTWQRILIGAVLIVVAVGVIGFIAWSNGLVHFPALTGAYRVGRIDYHLVDSARPEVFSEAPEDSRELMVTIYYPAEVPEGSQPAPLTTAALRDRFAEFMGTPGFLQDTIRPNSFTNVPAASSESGFPVIVFSPGMGFLPLLYTPTLEELASHGYIVVSIWHPYSTTFTLFPDGTMIRATTEAGSRRLSQVTAEATSAEEFESAVNLIGDVWVGDIRFVLDEMTRLNAEDALLAGTMDLSRVGVFGHSFGGGAAAEVLYQDERFAAAINLDGTLFGEVAHNGVARPFMLMLSERITLTDEQIVQAGSTAEAYAYQQEREAVTQAAVYENAAPGYRLLLNGATHRTFMTFEPLAAPLLFIPAEVVGTIPGERAAQIINAYIVAFFDKHLLGESVPLLDGASADYSEVQFETNG